MAGVAERVLPDAKVPGVSSGRGNMKATAQSVRTRIANGNANNISLKTAIKGAVGSQTADAYRTAAQADAELLQAQGCHTATPETCH